MAPSSVPTAAADLIDVASLTAATVPPSVQSHSADTAVADSFGVAPLTVMAPSNVATVAAAAPHAVSKYLEFSDQFHNLLSTRLVLSAAVGFASAAVIAAVASASASASAGFLFAAATAVFASCTLTTGLATSGPAASRFGIPVTAGVATGFGFGSESTAGV